MAEISQQLRKEVIEQKRRRRVKIVIALLVVLLLFFVFLWLLRYVLAHTYESYAVTSETLMPGGLVSLQNEGNLLFLCSNDGAKALNGDGSLRWEVAYQMDNPAGAACKEVAAVADIGGKSVIVIAENGIPYSYQTLYPIVKHAVAGQGVTAVLLDNGTEDFIQLYDINGNLRVDINTKTKQDGFPMDIALSNDGKKLVTAYVTFERESLVSKVTFYNAGEVGKNYIGNIVGQKSFENNQLVGSVEFLDNDTVCIVLENGFVLYRMTELPNLLCTKNFNEPLVDLVCGEGCVVLVTENVASGNRTMYRYNCDGKEAARWNHVPEYEKIFASSDEVILFAPQKVTVYRTNKTVKFTAEFTRNLEEVMFGGGNRYFLIDTGRIETIKLVDRRKEGGTKK